MIQEKINSGVTYINFEGSYVRKYIAACARCNYGRYGIIK